MNYKCNRLTRKKVKHTSIMSKKSKFANNMKNKYGQETETKKEDTFEEDEDKKQAQDLSNENEKQHDEEMKKS